jgi:hypothetical protein
MNKLILLAGASLLLGAAPAMAKPDGKGHSAKQSQTVYKAHGKQAKRGNIIHRGQVAANWWGNRNCPPGLAKKNNGCLPPGIAKKHFDLGDRWNGNYRQWSYNQVPTTWRTQYGLDPANRYYYRDGYLYSVDPRTRLVESVIQALIR